MHQRDKVRLLIDSALDQAFLGLPVDRELLVTRILEASTRRLDWDTGGELHDALLWQP